MTLHEFNVLPYERQLVHVFDEGTFLARRWKEGYGSNLYHLPGGFCWAEERASGQTTRRHHH
jgi:hypothetical protein